MPNYVIPTTSNPAPAAALYPGDTYQLFAAEAPAAGQASAAVAISPNPDGSYAPLAFDVENDATYTAADAIQIEGAMVDTPTAYQVLQTIATQQGYYADYGKFKFYRVVQSVRTGTEKVTVTVSR